MKVVIDTNVWLQALPSFSRYRPIVDSFLDGVFNLILTPEIFLEYEEIFALKTNPSIRVLILNVFLESPQVLTTEVYFRWSLITADPDDNKFTDAYLAGGADYLVTTDKHFDTVKNTKFPTINVVSPEAFLDVLKQKNLSSP